MVRLGLVLAVVAIAGSAHATGLPRHFGMYPAQGPALPMIDSQVAVTVRGPIVEATVTQTFRNDRDAVTEATYIFPLPDDAAVSAMAIHNGTRTIHAAIETREAARARYERAVAAGLGAALLDQERPDVFTQTVSAIPAHGTVSITLRFDATARYAGGTWELALPLVVAPRYVPGTASGRPTTGTGRAPDTDRSPDASRVTPGGGPDAGGATQITIAFADPVDAVTSPTHALSRAGGSWSLRDPHSDHDAVVRWRARVPAAGWVEQDADGGYAAVLVAAPPPAPRKAALSCLLVLDRAATTHGDADAVEHPLVRALLAALTPKDRIEVAGSDAIDAGTPEQTLAALERSWGRRTGAFDLTRVLRSLRAAGSAVVLVSDGLVADDRAALAAARKVGAPIHVVGVGPAPNRSLLAAIAAATGGTVRFAVVGDDVGAIARAVVSDAAAPPPPLAITWGTLGATEVVPATLPRLGAGQARLVVARVRHAQPANARVHGEVFGFTVVTPPRAPEGATTPHGTLARRWAKLRLDDLVAAGDRRAITSHALRYGLVSPTTSMVAVGDDVVIQGGVKHSVAVPVSVPAGMRWQEVRHEIDVDTTVTLDGKNRDVDLDARRQTRNAGGPATGATTQTTTPATEPKRAEAEPPADANAEAEGDDDEGGMPRPPAPAPVAMTDGAGAEEDREEADGEWVSRTGSISSHRLVRLSLALGTGVSVTGGNADALVALSGRAEFGRRTLFGMEGSLWLVGGLHAQGDTRLTVARRGLARRFELGGGLGFHIGDGAAGPALDLALRTWLPLPHLAGYLRYDGALLFHDGTRDGLHAVSVGLEAHW